MTRSTAAGNRFRTRKLSTKQSLAVLRESQIDSIDDDGQRYIPQIETGVDQREEIVCFPSPPLSPVTIFSLMSRVYPTIMHRPRMANNICVKNIYMQ